MGSVAGFLFIQRGFARFDKLSRALARQEGVVGIVIFPFAVASRQQDILLQQPVADERDIRLARMVVDHVGVRNIDLVGGNNRVVGVNHAYRDALLNAALDQRVAVYRQRLMRRIADFASQAAAAGRVAEGAGVALYEDAMKQRLARIVDPVFFRQVGAAAS